MQFLEQASEVIHNPSVEELIQACITEDGCALAESGAVVAYSGFYTGRTPKDKFVVESDETRDEIWWENNGAMDRATFQELRGKLENYASGRKLYVIDTLAGADPVHRIAVRFIAERPYHALFIHQLLIRPTAAELAEFTPDWTVADFGKYAFNPAVDGTRGDAVIALDLENREVIIGGTEYAGEMKKSVFTIMNFLLPRKGVLSMHCSANVGQSGDSALFFGLSGTGKTTLSTDPNRGLVGDDEHGWSDTGIFNIEGGCYAKCIGLSRDSEPMIFDAIRSGAILENVVLDADGKPDYNDGSITENTRCAYPLEHIPTAVHPSVAGHPENIFFLTSDAMGVLPPISRLTPEQAMYYFLNGYTSKLAGTEVGVKEPQLAFSACFGQPFLPLPPKAYAELLREKINRHGSRVWLVNTGWTGGGYGVGSRIKLRYTRAMLNGAMSGALDGVEYATHPIFGLAHPVSCPDVPSETLDPRATWADKDAYDQTATDLKAKFDENHAQFA